MGVAFGFSKMYDEALKSLDDAISVLNDRMLNLSGQTGSESILEIAEIEVVVPDIEAKIADLKEMKEGHAKFVSDAKGKVDMFLNKPF